MTIARITEDKDAKTFGALIALFIVFAIGVWIAVGENQRQETASNQAGYVQKAGKGESSASTGGYTR